MKVPEEVDVSLELTGAEKLGLSQEIQFVIGALARSVYTVTAT